LALRDCLVPALDRNKYGGPVRLKMGIEVWLYLFMEMLRGLVVPVVAGVRHESVTVDHLRKQP
jgi:hypothetical protein